MLEIYIKLLPVFAWFFLGVALRYSKLASPTLGERLLKFMFYVTLPVLILVKLTAIPLSIDKIYLPFLNIGANLFCLALMVVATRTMEIARSILGVMLVCSMITNNFFIFPFILAVLGDVALVDAMIFDIGNAFSTLAIAYAIAFRHGPLDLEMKNIIFNIIKLPALWALAVAISMNLNSIAFPGGLLNIMDPVGLLTNPLILVSLGLYFTPKLVHTRLLLLTVSIRMLGGLLISLAFVYLLALDGVTAMVVILCAAAPIGFNGLTFPALAKLDMNFASSSVSVSILVGLFSVPILLYLLQAFFKI